MNTEIAVVILVIVAGGALVVAVGAAVSDGQRRAARQLERVEDAVQAIRHELRTPEERAALARRIEEIEAQKREIHGRFGADGT